MSNSVVTNAGLALFASAAANHTTVSIDRMVFAYRADLDVEASPGADFALTQDEIRYESTSVNASLLSANSVVYSAVLGPEVGGFSFNIIGIKAGDALVAVAVQPVQTKLNTTGFTLGNTIIKNFALEISRAGELTGVTIVSNAAAAGLAIALAEAAAESARIAAENARAETQKILNSYTGKKLFEIFFTMSTEIPEGAARLDGGTLTNCNDDDSPYHEFYLEAKRRKAAGTIPCVTGAQYESILTEYGQCGSFVVNESKHSIRLPKITAYIQNGTPGNLHKAGLPNITGSITSIDEGGDGSEKELLTYADQFSTSGALKVVNKTQGAALRFTGDENNPGYRTISFDASMSNSIYGGANTVQPKDAEACYYIQYSTGTSAETGGGSGGSSGGGEMVVATSGATTAELALSGGVSYRFTNPMTRLDIVAVAAKGEDHVRFTLANGGDVTIPPECDLIPEDFAPEAGKTYRLTATDNVVVIVPCRPGATEMDEEVDE